MQKKLNKFERIKKLVGKNINTENSILIRYDEEPINKEKVNWLLSHEKYSLRTFFDDETNLSTEHYPVINSYYDIIALIFACRNKKLNCIVAECIDPADAEFAGSCLVLQNEIIIEIADGPVTVRKVTRDLEVDRRYILNKTKTELPKDNRLLKLIEMIFYEDLNNVNIEFSYYKKPVGTKKQRLIIWEIKEL